MIASPSTVSGARHIDALTSVRGIAAWWVVVFHYRSYLSDYGKWGIVIDNGYLAVDLFFILSGFVITLNYLDRMRTLNLSNVAEFISARLARIYPLHFVMLIAFLVNPLAITLFSRSGVIGDRYDAGSFLLSLALLHNWGFVDHLVWNIPSWSISSEWFAYLAFPILAFTCARTIKTPKAALLMIAVIIVIIMAMFSISGASSLSDNLPHMGITRCITQFMVGAVLSQIYIISGPQNAVNSTILVIGAIMLFFSSRTLDVPDFLVITIAFSMIIFGLCNTKAPLSQMLQASALLFLGRISYSTYMVHYFVFDWVKFSLIDEAHSRWLEAAVVYFGATLLFSVVAYRFVELPGRRLVKSGYRRLAALQGRAPLGKRAVFGNSRKPR